jgi:hypothetical protein
MGEPLNASSAKAPQTASMPLYLMTILTLGLNTSHSPSMALPSQQQESSRALKKAFLRRIPHTLGRAGPALKRARNQVGDRLAWRRSQSDCR